MRLVFCLFLVVATTPLYAFSEADSSKFQWQADAQDSTAPNPGVTLVKGLGLVLGTLFLGLGIYRRYFTKYSGIGSSPRMRIKERLALNGKSTLVLVEIDGRELLISTGAESTRLVQSLTRHDLSCISPEEQGEGCFDSLVQQVN